MAYFFFSVLTIITAIYLYKKPANTDNKFLLYIFVASMLLRCYLAALLSNFAYIHHCTGFISGDDLLYSNTALDLLEQISEGVYSYKLLYFGRNLYTYILAIFYGIFGFKVVAAKFINCYIGSLIPVAAYFLSMRLFRENRIARITSILLAFYPSIVFWSTHNVKEPLIILTVSMGIYLLLKTLSAELTVRDLGLLIIYSFMTLNLQLMYAYQIGILILVLFLVYSTKIFRIALSALLAISFIFVLFKTNIVQRFIIFSGEHQWLMAVTDRAGYYLYTPDFINNLKEGHFNVLAFLFIYLKGVAYFLFTPFSWRLQSLLQVVSLPQMLLWYLFWVFSVIGFIKSFKGHRKANIALFVFIFTGISFWALTEGNIGAAFRHRDHFAVAIFIYAGAGIVYFVDFMKSFMRKTK